ncbi:hypothetical protein Cfor_10819 [Coptotermes formosanus]|uniref:Uncharacterized protein n=1 Tax=Coptotermes formosanus TaxID=36987 RepID=A0A6L2PRY8_COPFO|nr:hypothetical protein Cfor_10819 [Coptotermes formosanus]
MDTLVSIAQAAVRRNQQCVDADVGFFALRASVVQTSRQSLIDLVVALVSVPLLVVFGLMLESNMRGDWTRDGETRWYVLSLGIVLLFVSIMVCGYVTHRLGICIWAVAQEPGNPRHESNGTGPRAGSQIHLVVGGELPPSYESVVSHDTPPPYCSVQILNEKLMYGVPATAADKQATG